MSNPPRANLGPCTEQEVQHMAALLNGLIQPDTNTIRQAEAQLKPLLKQHTATTMVALWNILAQPSYSEGVRHSAALVLRKKLPAYFSTLPPATQHSWMEQVLQALALETSSRPVRTGLLGVVAALAQTTADSHPLVLQFLQAAMNNHSDSSRELCFSLMDEMTETIGTHWQEHLLSLRQMYEVVLLQSQNHGPRTQKAAVQSLGSLMRYWADEDPIEGLVPLLPALLQVANQQKDDEDLLAAVLDVLYELSFSTHASLAPYTTLCVEFALQCMRHRELELRVRDAAALVIANTAEAKPKTFGRNEPMLGAVLDTLFELMKDSSESAAGALFESNPSWKADLEEEMDNDNNEHDMDSPTETSMAQGTLDAMACEIPKKFFWPAALARCVQYLQQSHDPNARKAGIAGFGVIAEGCAEPMTSALHQVMPLVFQAAQDPYPQVRECACFCLGQISEHCQPDVLQYSEQILPIVFQLLDDKSVAVQATSCYVLEMFCERLEPSAVRPILDPLVKKLASMLEHTNKRSVQEMTVAALAATSVAAEEEFAPYVDGVARLMKPLMSITDPSLFSLRGRAVECMGHMAVAVGRDTFRPHFHETMRYALEGLSVDNTELHEFAYALFANLAKIMKDEFSPALSDLVPHLVNVLETEDAMYEKADQNQQFNLDDSDDEDGDGDNLVLNVRTGLVDVKKGALTALGEMAAFCGKDFCMYLENVMQALIASANNWHPLIRAEVADTLPSMVVPSIGAYHNGEVLWKKGVGGDYLSAHTKTLVTAVLAEEKALMASEDKIVAAKACEGVQTVIELCGPAALEGSLNEILEITYAILTKEAPCCADVFGEGPDEDDDHDNVSQSACDLVGAFCRVLGPHFLPFLDKFLPVICEYGKSSRPTSDRIMAIGSLSEIAEHLEGNIGQYWNSFFKPAIFASLSDEDTGVKRNGAFCCGLCASNLSQQISGDFPQLLSALAPIFSLPTDNDDSAAACVDNTAGAIARMIMAAPQAVPLSQVIPALLSAIPLKDDYTENEPVYKCVLGLIESKNADMISNANEARKVLTAACSETSVNDETKAKIQQALQSLA